MTQKVVERILDTSECNLPVFAESMNTHLRIVEPLIKFFEKKRMEEGRTFRAYTIAKMEAINAPSATAYFNMWNIISYYVFSDPADKDDFDNLPLQKNKRRPRNQVYD